MQSTLPLAYTATNNFEHLYPFQKEGVNELLKDNRHRLLADDMGLGKTNQALTYLKTANAFPALVVCPASLKLNWQREALKWAGEDALVLSGREPSFDFQLALKRHNIIIINYDILAYKKDGATKGWIDVLKKHDFKTIIADEMQAISDPDTIRTKAFVHLCTQRPQARRILLSGTPYETKTAQFQVGLSLLSNQFSNRYQFLHTYCNPQRKKIMVRGRVKEFWAFDGLTNGKELHEKIKPLMIRRLKQDVLTQLPPKQKIIVPMEASKSAIKKYHNLEEQFQLDLRSGVKQKSDMIGLISKLKQEAVAAKMESAIKWIKEYFEYSEKLVVFCYHVETFNALMSEFKKVAVGINGSTPTNIRQAAVDNFQNKDNIKLFVGQIIAAGTGLTLTKASATCFIEFGQTAVQHEQAEDRVHRIGQEASSVQAYYLILPNTIEERIMKKLTERHEHQRAVWDGEENSQFFQGQLERFNEGLLSITN